VAACDDVFCSAVPDATARTVMERRALNEEGAFLFADDDLSVLAVSCDHLHHFLRVLRRVPRSRYEYWIPVSEDEVAAFRVDLQQGAGWLEAERRVVNLCLARRYAIVDGPGVTTATWLTPSHPLAFMIAPW